MKEEENETSTIGCLILIACLFIAPWLFDLAWNYAAPTFGLPILGYWITLAGLYVLRVIGGALFKK